MFHADLRQLDGSWLHSCVPVRYHNMVQDEGDERSFRHLFLRQLCCTGGLRLDRIRRSSYAWSSWLDWLAMAVHRKPPWLKDLVWRRTDSVQIEGLYTVLAGAIYMAFYPKSRDDPVPFTRITYFNERERHIIAQRVILDDPSKVTGARKTISMKELRWAVSLILPS